MVRPALEANVPTYMNLDTTQWNNYLDFIAMTEEQFMCIRFPKEADMMGRPLMLTAKTAADRIEQVLAAFSEVQPSDAYLRFIHEEFFVAPPFEPNTCQFYVTEQLVADDIVREYVLSYIKKVGS